MNKHLWLVKTEIDHYYVLTYTLEQAQKKVLQKETREFKEKDGYQPFILSVDLITDGDSVLI